MSEPQSSAKPPPLSPEEVTQLLKMAARKRRPWTVWSVLFCLVLIGVPVGLLLWWLWPRPALPHVLVLTFDEVAVSGAVVTLRAQLRPADDEDPGVSLRGIDVYFKDVTNPQRAGLEPWQEQTQSDEHGVATARWQPPASPMVGAFEARIFGDRRRKGGLDTGRVFLWPANTPLLVVDADTTLTDAPISAWRRSIPADVRRPSESAEALQTARAKGYQIVYLALAVDEPLAYRKVRDWVQHRPPANQKRFPDGPVLGRPSYAGDMDEGQARHDLLDGLRQRFSGPLAGVARQARTAEAYRTAGLRTYLVAEGEVPAGVTRLKTWAELPTALVPAPK
jgi:hypothetical protein